MDDHSFSIGRTRSDRRFALGRVSAAVLVVASGLLLAGPRDAAGQTLQDAWARAYYSNPTLEAQRAQLRATDEQVSQALSGWRPTVQATASAGISDQSTNVALGAADSTLYPRTFSLAFQQPLYRGGRTVAQTSRAERNVEAQRARLMATEQQLFLDIGTAYMNVIRDQAVLDLNRNNERVIARQLQATRDRSRSAK